MSETADEAVPALLEPLPDVKEEKQWSVAVGTRDCKRLMELLHQNPQLWLQSGPKDRNVLHVAIMQGCVKLLKQVLEAPVDNGNLHEFQKNVKKLLKTKDGRCRADAFDLAAVVGIPKIIELLKSVETKLTNGSMHGATSSHGANSQMTDAPLHNDQDKPIYNDSNDEDEINEMIEELPRSVVHDLEELMKEDVDFNFEEERKGLIFHFACKRAKTNAGFIKTVVDKAEEKGLLLKLFNQMDAKGRPPLHVATDFCGGGELDGIKALLDKMPADCVNGLDGAGRTPLLRAAANGMSLSSSKLVKVLADNELTDLNAKWPGNSGATALHVAVLHSHAYTAKYLLEAKRTNKTNEAKREEIMEREIKVFKYQWHTKWTPLELAAVMGRFFCVEAAAANSRKGLLPNWAQRGSSFLKSFKSIGDTRCLHLAAAAGDPRSIQALLLNRSDDLHNFECNKDFEGYTCLHFAVYATLPHQKVHPGVKAIDPAFDRFLAFSDFASIYWLERELTTAASKGPQKLGMTVIGYGGKKTCTNLLLQAGVDIWSSATLLQAVSDATAKASDALAKESVGESSHDQDDELLEDYHNTAVPDPGSDACDDDRLWWYDVVARDTLEAKSNFNAAGNATAVVATLVATASFVGPFSPPLGYVSDAANELQVLMTSRPIRIFMTSNSVSFYLAIASLMLAIMPSLPMPQEGQREELHRSERTVALAISVLLVALLGNLIAFTSCLIAVLPENSYWGYKFYPAFVGGFVCVLVILVFFLRLLRLVFKKNARIKSFYRLFGKL